MMEKTVLKVEGMSCDHCVKSITQGVGALPGVASVAVDLTAKIVTVDFNPTTVSIDKIKAAIDDQGYEVMR
ncbi:MAG: copper chaperone CopZ [Selenomonadaceae bacterium]